MKLLLSRRNSSELAVLLVEVGGVLAVSRGLLVVSVMICEVRVGADGTIAIAKSILRIVQISVGIRAIDHVDASLQIGI